jgi:hypothetical protein
MNRPLLWSAIICFAMLPAALAHPVGVETLNVSGDWDLKVETPQGTATPSITLNQQGERLSGTYRGRMGETALEGTIQDDGSIRFSVKLKFQDQEFLVIYSGKVDGAEMSGTVKFGESRSGKWTAHRKTSAVNSR